MKLKKIRKIASLFLKKHLYFWIGLFCLGLKKIQQKWGKSCPCMVLYGILLYLVCFFFFSNKWRTWRTRFWIFVPESDWVGNPYFIIPIVTIIIAICENIQAARGKSTEIEICTMAFTIVNVKFVCNCFAICSYSVYFVGVKLDSYCFVWIV